MDQPPANNHQRRPLAWIPELFLLGQKRVRGQVRLLGLAILVGVVAGLGAIVFYVATRAAERSRWASWSATSRSLIPAERSPFRGFPRPVPPFVPGSCCWFRPSAESLAVCWSITLAPEAEGHGTDAVIEAYHRRQGQIRPRVPLVKIVASALTLGSGGSGGREGPIAQIGAGFGSLLGNLLHLRPAERRMLMAAGMGAGIAAIFRARWPGPCLPPRCSIARRSSSRK